MHNSEKMGNAGQGTNPNYEKWKGLQGPKIAECRFDNSGDAIFSKFRDRIVFGETPYTQRVDLLPGEKSNGDDIYHSAVAKIETSDGNIYYINQGIFLDTKNAKYVDILEKRRKKEDRGEEYNFPDIMIGYNLPFDEISCNLPRAQGAYVTRVSFLNVPGSPTGSNFNSDLERNRVIEYMTKIRKAEKNR